MYKKTGTTFMHNTCMGKSELYYASLLFSSVFKSPNYLCPFKYRRLGIMRWRKSLVRDPQLLKDPIS